MLFWIVCYFFDSGGSMEDNLAKIILEDINDKFDQILSAQNTLLRELKDTRCGKELKNARGVEGVFPKFIK